jgi:PHP family Zn ribbon phosphoesterase
MAAVISTIVAEAFFSTRFNSEAWTNLGSEEGKKIAVLTTATNQLSAVYELDTTIEEHVNAVCEQALFLLIGGGGVDMRATLQAMGVAETSVNDEKFRVGTQQMVCQYARTVLRGLEKQRKPPFAKFQDVKRIDK